MLTPSIFGENLFDEFFDDFFDFPVFDDPAMKKVGAQNGMGGLTESWAYCQYYIKDEIYKLEFYTKSTIAPSPGTLLRERNADT